VRHRIAGEALDDLNLSTSENIGGSENFFSQSVILKKSNGSSGRKKQWGWFTEKTASKWQHDFLHLQFSIQIIEYGGGADDGI
jgi:hypothetical protein